MWMLILEATEIDALEIYQLCLFGKQRLRGFARIHDTNGQQNSFRINISPYQDTNSLMKIQFSAI